MDIVEILHALDMEQQFILRLPESLKYIDINEAQIISISNREVQLKYKNSVFPGIICRPPTIIESFKKIENKMYKIADIAGLVIIYGQNNIDVDGEIQKNEESGITPPLHKIKERYIQGYKIQPERMIEIERRVMELLEKDGKAQSVEVVYNSKIVQGNANDSIDEIAAEIENELEGAAETVKTDGDKTIEESEDMEDRENSKEISDAGDEANDRELEDLEEKIREKKQMADQALNPILRKRFQQSVEELEKKYEEKKRK